MRKRNDLVIYLVDNTVGPGLYLFSSRLQDNSNTIRLMMWKNDEWSWWTNEAIN